MQIAGSTKITALRRANGYDSNLLVTVCLPNAAAVRSVEVDAIDMGEKTTFTPQRNGNELTITLPKHGKATVILLHMRG